MLSPASTTTSTRSPFMGHSYPSTRTSAAEGRGRGDSRGGCAVCCRPMGALLGLAAALAYGVSDYVAGVASRAHHFLWVSLLGMAASRAGAGVTVAVQGDRPVRSAVAWGSLSGIGTAVGTLGLFRGYGRGEMAVAGPLSALGAAAFPAIVGTLLGERLTRVALVGVLLAFPAI